MNVFLMFVVLSVTRFTPSHGIASSEVLLVSHGNSILRLEEGDRTELVSAAAPVTAFDIHVGRQQLFYAAAGAIYRTPLYDLSTTTPLAVTGVVGGLVVDWVHHHVYWTDLTHGRLEVVGLDGSDRRIVHTSPLLAGALVLDPDFGDLVWMERLPQAKDGLRIMCSKLDGSGIFRLAGGRHVTPNSPLAVDTDFKGVYFYQGNSSVSEQWEVTYPWSDSKAMLFERNESCPAALTIGKDGFFYSNGEGLWSGTWKRTIITVAFGNTTQTVRMLTPRFTLIDQTLKNATQIRVMTQSEFEDQCSRPSRPCWHRCVTTGIRRTACVCPFGFVLAPDQSSCRELGYIVARTTTSIGRAALDGSNQTILYSNHSANIHAFDLHPGHRLVYWTDLAAEAVFRAPVDKPTRCEAVVKGVSAYGVAVDWLHDHLYWTEHTRIMAARLDGSSSIMLVDNVDAPAAIAVDPVNTFIFWIECGIYRRLRRANLDGSDIVTISDDIDCDTSLSVDPVTRTIFWLVRTGVLSSCSYSGAAVTFHVHQLPRAFTVHDRVLWIPHSDLSSVEAHYDVYHGIYSFQRIDYNRQAVEIRVMKSPLRRLDPDGCMDTDCPGLCLLSPNQTVPRCLCTGPNNMGTGCTNHTTMNKNNFPPTSLGGTPYLILLNTTAFSATLRCAGPLLTHPILQPYVHVDEIDSLVPRNGIRASFVVKVNNKSLPFTIDSLNPATTYKLTVRNRVTRAAKSIEVHTRPPPLAVHRLPEVTVPGLERPVSWQPQGIHYFSPNVWENYIQREYMLLLLSKKEYLLSNSPNIDEKIYFMVKNGVKLNFMVLQYYKSKEDFDDDPTMHLGNLMWGEDFWLAMVQVTQYRQQYGLDVVYSARFRLPDHSGSYRS